MMATIVGLFIAAAASAAPTAHVTIVYFTRSNHTLALATAIGNGALLPGGRSEVRVKSIAEADVEADILDWADAVLIGCPTHYGNPASDLLAWVETAWAPFWQDARFDGKLGATFATAGGLAQGLENVVTSLQRSLLSFRVQLLASGPATSAFASYGAVAVTGAPFKSNSSLLAPEFVAAGEALGKHVAEAVLARKR